MNNSDSIIHALSQYTDRVTKQIKDIVAQSAQDIAERAKANAPDAVKNSITIETSDDGLSATVTANSADAANTEYGLGNNQPKPFLNPAFEGNRQKVIDSIAQILEG